MTASLVGRLAKQAEKQPDLIECHKRRRMVLDSKKEAIEETTKDMLSRNKPIVRL